MDVFGIEFPWSSLIAGAIGGGLGMILTKYYFNRPASDPGAVIMVRTPRWMVGGQMFGTLCFGAFVPLIIINPGDEMADPLRLILGLFVACIVIIYLPLSIDAWVRETVWDGRRLRYRRGFGRHGDRALEEIVDLRWRPMVTHWRIGFADGSGLGVPAVGRTTPYLIQAVADHLGVEPKGLDEYYPKFINRHDDAGDASSR